MHSDIGNVVLGDHIDDGRIHLSGRDVIDDHRAECFEHPPGYLGTERIDRNGQCGSDPPHGGHPRFHTTPLLLGRHLGGSGPGGVASDVEQIATGIGRFADTPFDSLGTMMLAAATGLLSACQKLDEVKAYDPDKVVAPVLHALPGEIVITPDNMGSTQTFTWDAADFGVRTPIINTISTVPASWSLVATTSPTAGLYALAW